MRILTNWFYILALIISAVFAIAIIVVFICTLKIYFNIEKTLLKIKKNTKKNV